MVQHFHKLDIKIAIDDYGTLHSNARRVESINPDYVKIDGPWFAFQFHQPNFISQLADVHQYFEAQGIQLIYEGVETYEMLVMAKACDAKLFQGYLLGTPQLTPTIIWSSNLLIINPPPID